MLLTRQSEATLDAARKDFGSRAIVVKSDAASLAEIDVLAARINAECDALDARLVCAGHTRYIPFEDVTEDICDELLAVAAKGPYFTVQELAPLTIKGSGVVFVTSVSSAMGLPMIRAYAASKAALRSMARSLGRELLPREIRVNAVSAGPIDSGILENDCPCNGRNTPAGHAVERPAQGALLGNRGSYGIRLITAALGCPSECGELLDAEKVGFGATSRSTFTDLHFISARTG